MVSDNMDLYGFAIVSEVIPMCKECMRHKIAYYPKSDSDTRKGCNCIKDSVSKKLNILGKRYHKHVVF